MLAPYSIHFSQLEQLGLSMPTITRLLTACALGGAIGMEREWKHKPSGLRTNMLICLACALFTILSAALAGDSQDKSRVASNIVQGIGFLGAGLILHTRNRVQGLTSAATVFVVASIGMASGAGLYLPAVFATAIVGAALQLIGMAESRSRWKFYGMVYELRWTANAGELPRLYAALLELLDRDGYPLNIVERDSLPGFERVRIAVLTNQARHKALLHELREKSVADAVLAYPDGEQD
jgi:putative Mg2+ transporter-C (MgtC) family protein